MLGSAVIVFREVLEAALIVAVVMGASRGIAGRGRWVASGLALGIAGACVVAAFAGGIADAVEGRGQEFFNAAVLLLAVAMLAWHNVWMSAHGRRLAEDVRRIGSDVRIGAKPLTAMLAITALAVLREGSETVLFLYGLAAGGAGRWSLAGGAALGIACGVLLGWALYRGLVRIPLRRFFTVTGWIILLLAAGLAAAAADYLNQAGVLPALVSPVWDSSWLLSQQSLIGQTLHILVGYQDRPSGIGLLAYVLTLAVIGALMALTRHARRPRADIPAATHTA